MTVTSRQMQYPRTVGASLDVRMSPTCRLAAFIPQCMSLSVVPLASSTVSLASRERGRQRKSMMISVMLSRASLVPIQAKSLHSQALDLVIKRVNFLGGSRVPGFRRVGTAQFFQRFLNGQLRCFSHA